MVISTRRGDVVRMHEVISIDTGVLGWNKEVPHCGLTENWLFGSTKSLECVTCVATLLPAMCTMAYYMIIYYAVVMVHLDQRGWMYNCLDPIVINFSYYT